MSLEVLNLESGMADPVKAIIIVLVIAIALIFGFCCHFASRREDAEDRARQQAARAGTSGNTNRNNTGPVFIFGLQGTASNSNAGAAREAETNPTEDQPNEIQPDENRQSPDPIADSGPPPYRCVTVPSDPLPPPPSYEEALRASTEHLAISRQHIV